MSHILEQYLSGTDDNTSDYIAEGLMRSLIVSSRKALADPCDYEARSGIDVPHRHSQPPEACHGIGAALQ